MILRKNILLLVSTSVVFVTSDGTSAGKKAKPTRKPTIDELPLQHILLRSIMKHDGCKLYYPWSNQKNPSFELNNATCWHGCKIVADLYEAHWQTRPRLIRSGGCKKTIKLIYLECKCELTPDYATLIRWRTLQHCARTYLEGIVDFSINDTRPSTTPTVPPTEDEAAWFDERERVQRKRWSEDADEPTVSTGAAEESSTQEVVSKEDVETGSALTTVTSAGTNPLTTVTSVGTNPPTTVTSADTSPPTTAATTTSVVEETTFTPTIAPTSTPAGMTSTVAPTTAAPAIRRRKKKKPNKPWRRNG